MEQHEKKRLYWGCRRGMLELDLLLLPFFEQHFDSLTPDEQALFPGLLEQSDPVLFAWLMGHEVCEPQFAGLVEKIRNTECVLS